MALVARLLVYTTVWALSPRCVSGFASYMTNKPGCMIDLDPTEVIMNNPVRAAKSWSEAMNGDAYNNNDPKMILASPLDETPLDLDDSALSSPQGLAADRRVFIVDKMPTTILVKIQGKVPGAQYILQAGTYGDPDKAATTPAATFPDGGQCNDKTRWSGNVNDGGADLTITEDNAEIWAGWAAGHEAVQLLPGYVFRLKSPDAAGATAAADPAYSSFTASKQQQDWIEFMTTEVGCTSIQLSDSPMEVVGRNVMLSGDAGKLSPGEMETIPSENSVAYHIEFETTGHSVEELVVEVTAGASFSSTFHASKIACGDQRIIWPQVPAESFGVGTLTVKKSSTASQLASPINVRAIYSVKGEETLYITPTLSIKRDAALGMNAEMNVVDDQSDMERIVDPQKALEQGLKSKMDLLNLHEQVAAHKVRLDSTLDKSKNRHHREQIKGQYKIKEPVGGDPAEDLVEASIMEKIMAEKPQKRKDLLERRKYEGDSEDYPEMNLHEKIKADYKIREPLDKRMQVEVKKETDRDLKHDLHERVQKAKAEQLQKKPFDRKIYNNKKLGVGMNQDDGTPTVSFDSNYFSALLFFVVGTAAALQICRFASKRGPKGRREL